MAETKRPHTVRRWAVRTAKTVGLLLVGVCIALGTLIAVLQTSWGAEQVRDLLEAQVNQTINGTLSIDRLEGNFITHITARNVRLTQTADSLLTLDRLSLRYSLWPLLNRTVDLHEVRLTGAGATLRRYPDQTWNVARLLPPSADTTAAEPLQWTIRVARFDLEDARTTVQLDGTDPNTIRTDSLHASLRNVHYGPETWGGSLERLSLGTHSRSSTAPLQVDISAGYEDHTFRLDTLHLSSTGTEISARAFYHTNPAGSLNAHVSLNPVSLSELHPWLPQLPDQGSLSGSLMARGPADSIQVTSELALRGNNGTTNNGSVSLEGYGSLPDVPALAYDFTARIRQLNLAAVTGQSEHRSNLNLDVRTTLSGPELRRLNGQLTADLSSSSWDDAPLPRGTFESQWTDGTIDFGLSAEGETSAADLTGHVAPFQELPSYAVEGSMTRLNALEWVTDPPQESSITGRFSLTGEGFDPATAQAKLNISAAPVSVHPVTIDRTELSVQYADEQITARTLLEIGGGRIQASTQILPLATPLAYPQTSITFDRVNLAEALGDTTYASSLSGRIAFSGKGVAPDEMTLTGEAQLSDSEYLSRTIPRVTSRFRLARQQIELETEAEIEGARMSIIGRGRPFAAVPAVEHMAVDFQHVDLGRLAADTTFHSNLNGRLTAQGRGTSTDNWTVSTVLQIDSSQVNQQAITSGNGRIEANSDSLAIQADITLPEGGLTVDGSIHSRNDDVHYRLARASISHFNAGAWLGMPSYPTDLTATFSVRGRGLELETANASGSIQVEPSQIAGRVIQTGFMRWKLAEGSLRGQSQLQLADGTVSGLLEAGSLSSTPSVYLDLDGSNLNAAHLAGWNDLSSDVTFGATLRGRGQDLSDLDLDGSFSLSSSTFAGVKADTLHASIRYSNGVLTADTLFLASNLLTASGGGTLALPEDAPNPTFRLSGEIPSLTPLTDIIGASRLRGNGRFDVRVQGVDDAVRFTADSKVTQILYNDWRVGGLENRFLGEYRDSLQWRLVTTTSSISLPNFVVQELGTQMYYNGQNLSLTATWDIDKNRYGSLGGTYEPGSDPLLRLENLSMQMGPDHWTMARPVPIRWTEGLQIEQFLIQSKNQYLFANGTFDPSGSHDLTVATEGLALKPFASLFGYPQMQGRLRSSFILSGPADNPNFHGDIFVPNLAWENKPLGTLQSRLTYRDFGMQVNGQLTHEREPIFAAQGVFPLDISTGSGEPSPASNRDLRLQISADSLSMHWATAFFDPAYMTDIEGMLSADVSILGQVDDPRFDGKMRLTGGRVRLPDLGATYHHIGAYATLQDSTVHLQKATMRSGNGTLEANGTVHVQQMNVGEMDFTIQSHRFVAAGNQTFRMTLDSDMYLRGTTTRPVLGGSVRLRRGEFYLTEDLMEQEVEAVTLTEADLQTLERRFGISVTETDTSTFDFYNALHIDTLEVRADRDVWLRSTGSPRMNIELAGRLSVTKPRGGFMDAFGTIEVLPARSIIEQFGRRFEITEGRLLFNGPVANPRLNITAEYEVPHRNVRQNEVSISLTLQGPLEDLNFSISSAENLTTNQIASYLVLGRPPSGGLGSSGGTPQAENVAMNAALSQVTNRLEGLAASQLGLDVVEIRHDVSAGATLTAGTYLTPTLYAGISWPIGLSSGQDQSLSDRQVTLEYSFTDWLLFRLQRRNNTMGLDFLWEYSY